MTILHDIHRRHVDIVSINAKRLKFVAHNNTCQSTKMAPQECKLCAIMRNFLVLAVLKMLGVTLLALRSLQTFARCRLSGSVPSMYSSRSIKNVPVISSRRTGLR